MEFRMKRSVVIGLVAGVLVSGSSFLFITLFDFIELFYFLFGIGILVGMLPFVVSSIMESRVAREKDEMFLEFARSLVESVESGTPISKSIINMKYKSFGSLSLHVEKLANQIQLGIPLQQALQTFAQDTKSKTIIRAITLIREADKTGGNINAILESVAKSVSEIENLRAERRAAISSIVVEGYIIFLIFVIIMVVLDLFLLPNILSIQNLQGAGSAGPLGGLGGIGGEGTDISSFSNALLFLLIAQGLFAGLIIGRLAEGNIKAGIKHSFAMIAMAVLISTGSKIIFG